MSAMSLLRIFAAITEFAVTEPPAEPPTPRPEPLTRRASIAKRLRRQAIHIRAGIAPEAVHADSVLESFRVRRARAANFDHLALLVENHPAFPNIHEDAMPPCEFAAFNYRPEPRRLGGTSFDFAGQDR